MAGYGSGLYGRGNYGIDPKEISVTVTASSSASVSAVKKWEPEPVTPEVWTPQETTSETWTPLSDTSETWTPRVFPDSLAA